MFNNKNFNKTIILEHIMCGECGYKVGKYKNVLLSEKILELHLRKTHGITTPLTSANETSAIKDGIESNKELIKLRDFRSIIKKQFI